MMWRKVILPAFLVMFVTAGVFAQERERGPRGERGERGDREGMAERWGARDGEGRGDPRGRGPGAGGGMAGRLMENLQEQLGVDDGEWEVLQPKIQNVMTAQRDLRMGGMAGAFGGGRGGEGGTSRIATASRNLRTAIQNENTSGDELARLLEEYRQARTEAEAQLETAQAELRELLTQRQEAVLVLAGILT